MNLKFYLPLFGVLLLMVQCKLMDLRPSNNLDKSDSGRRILLKSIDQYGGLDKWKERKYSAIIVEDKWPTFIWRALANPWKNKSVEFEFSFQHGKDNSRLRMLTGKENGKEFGIQQWCTYSFDNGPVFKKDKQNKFTLPTMQYFFEFPFRIIEASTIKYLNDKTVEGTDYHVLFATWGSIEPNKSMDQYLIYVNKDNWLIDFIEFTVRDVSKSTYGTVKYDGTISNEGIKFPKQITAFFQNRVPGKLIGHQMEIKSFVTDKQGLSYEYFVLDKNRNCDK